MQKMHSTIWTGHGSTGESWKYSMQRETGRVSLKIIPIQQINFIVFLLLFSMCSTQSNED